MSRKPRNWRLRNVLATPATVALSGVLSIAALGVPPAPRHTLVVWNASASAPIGLYYVEYGRPFARGDLVLAIPAPPLAAFAAHRGYLPLGVPLVKRIAAHMGDTVCARGNAIFINGRFAAARLAADGKGRVLPAWSGCRKLHFGEVFLLMADVRTSFDGRYFGPTPASQVVGLLDPIWTR